MNTEQERADFEAWYADAMWGNEDFKQSLERAYQAGRAALQSQPNTGELPRQSREAVLRAMSRNYTPGKHTWDSLDSDACAKGADEIRQLRAALVLQSQDREDAERYRAWRKVVASQNGNFLRLVSNELPDWDEGPVDESRIDAAIDHARRIEEEGNKCS